jgi:hypothetical protein
MKASYPAVAGDLDGETDGLPIQELDNFGDNIPEEDIQAVRDGARFDHWVHEYRLGHGKHCLWVQTRKGSPLDIPHTELTFRSAITRFGKTCGYFGDPKNWFGMTCFRKLFIFTVINSDDGTDAHRTTFLNCHCENETEVRLKNYINKSDQRKSQPGAIYQDKFPADLRRKLLNNKRISPAYSRGLPYFRISPNIDEIRLTESDVLTKFAAKNISIATPFAKLNICRGCPYNNCDRTFGHEGDISGNYIQFRTHLMLCKHKTSVHFECDCKTYCSEKNQSNTPAQTLKNLWRHIAYNCPLTTPLIELAKTQRQKQYRRQQRSDSTVPHTRKEHPPNVTFTDQDRERILHIPPDPCTINRLPSTDQNYQPRQKPNKPVRKDLTPLEKFLELISDAPFDSTALSSDTISPDQHKANMARAYDDHPNKRMRNLSQHHPLARNTARAKTFFCPSCNEGFGEGARILQHMKTSATCPASQIKSTANHRMGHHFIQRAAQLKSYIASAKQLNTNMHVYCELTGCSINLGRWLRLQHDNYKLGSPSFSHVHLAILAHIGVPWANEGPTVIANKASDDATKNKRRMQDLKAYFDSDTYASKHQLPSWDSDLGHWLQQERALWTKDRRGEYKISRETKKRLRYNYPTEKEKLFREEKLLWVLDHSPYSLPCHHHVLAMRGSTSRDSNPTDNTAPSAAQQPYLPRTQRNIQTYQTKIDELIDYFHSNEFAGSHTFPPYLSVTGRWIRTQITTWKLANDGKTKKRRKSPNKNGSETFITFNQENLQMLRDNNLEWILTHTPYKRPCIEFVTNIMGIPIEELPD